jgi:hypothetical protein
MDRATLAVNIETCPFLGKMSRWRPFQSGITVK